MPVAGLLAMLAAAPASRPRDLALTLCHAGAGGPSPVLPFSLEFLALRRLTASAFGTLMSLEPAIALLLGFLVLGQTPGPAPAAGVAFVVLAGVGATRTGARPEAKPVVGAPCGAEPQLQQAV